MEQGLFEIKPGVIDELVEEVIAASGYSSEAEARDADLCPGLDDVRRAFQSDSGPGPAWELYDFAYLLCARNGYLRPDGFGAKAIFPVVESASYGAELFRVEVCVDGGLAVRSPAFEPEWIARGAPTDFDSSIRRLRRIGDQLAEWGTKLIPSARAFANA